MEEMQIKSCQMLLCQASSENSSIATISLSTLTVHAEAAFPDAEETVLLHLE